MLSQRQVAILAGFLVFAGSGSARAQDVCALEQEVAELESDAAALADQVGSQGEQGPQGDPGSDGAQGPAGNDAFDGAEAEYGPRLEAVNTDATGLAGGIAAAVASANALADKIDAVRQKVSNINRNPYLIEGTQVGGYQVLAWPEGVDELSYAVNDTTVVTCPNPATSPYCTWSVSFIPGVIPPSQCNSTSGALTCGGDDTSVNLDYVNVEGELVYLSPLEFDFSNPLAGPTNVTPELVDYVKALGRDPAVVFGICNSFLSVFGHEYAGEWSREPALRVARRIREDAATIDARLAALEADPPIAPEDAGDPDAATEASASYTLARQGIVALTAATEEEAAKFIHASAIENTTGTGVWRYLYTLEQAEMFLEGIQGETQGWSAAKLASFNAAKTNVERLLESRQEAVRARAVALNSEWQSIAYGEQMLLVDLFKSPDYPDIIALAQQHVQNVADADMPPDIARFVAGAGAAAVPFAAAGAAALVSAGISAAIAAGTAEASLFAGIGAIATGGAAGVAGAVAVVLFPVVVATAAITIAVVAGMDAWETAENHEKYELWMANFDKSYDLAEIGDDAIRAAFVDWALTWYPKHGVGVGMGCQ